MTQGYDPNFDIYTEPWGTTGNKLNDFFKTIFSLNAGEAAPSNPLSGTPWLDVSNGWTNAVLKFYNGSDWVSAIEYNEYTKDLRIAKGSKDTLWERLEVALNEDGTLKSEQAENLTEWVDSALTATYVSATEFSVEGDQTDIFVQNRKIKATLSGSIVYSVISSSSYVSTGDTTTITLEDGVLDNTLQKIEYGFVKPGEDGSLPKIVQADNADTVDNIHGVNIARSGGVSTGTDLNTVITSGFYKIGANHANAPTGVDYGQLIVAHGGGDTIAQIVADYNSNDIYWRSGNPTEIGGIGDWKPWKSFWHSGNDENFMLKDGTRGITGKLTFQLPLTDRTRLVDLMQNYGIFSDNVGSGADNTRIWIDGPDGGEFVIGPRAGASIFDTISFRATNILADQQPIWHNGNAVMSKSQTGYQKLPSGLILQWGQVAVGNIAFHTVTFPITFPNAIVGAWAIQNSEVQAQSNFYDYYIVVCNTFTTSQVQFRTSVNSSTHPGLFGFTWFAIGY